MEPTDYDNADRRFIGLLFIFIVVMACLFVATGGKCVTAMILLPALGVALR